MPISYNNLADTAMSEYLPKGDFSMFFNDSDFMLTPEEAESLQEAVTPDYIRIIEYLEEKENQNATKNKILFISTIVASIFSGIAAIASIFALFQ